MPSYSSRQFSFYHKCMHSEDRAHNKGTSVFLWIDNLIYSSSYTLGLSVNVLYSLKTYYPPPLSTYCSGSGLVDVSNSGGCRPFDFLGKKVVAWT